MRRTHLVVYLIECWRHTATGLAAYKTLVLVPVLTRPIDSDINKLILDYLTTEGYPSAAAKFSKEANLGSQQDEDSVRSRQEIQHSIHLGSIQEAIDALNELEPQVSLIVNFVFPPRCYD